MWYNIIVVCILLYFLARGAAKGLVWQLAGIAGILLCVTFAGTASKIIGPHINLPAPTNQWAVMFITYLLASFVAFGFARTLNTWIEKMELKEYNRHLGAAFGLLKGALLVLIMTFMIVTFSEKSRSLIVDSKAAHIAAKIIHQLEPIVPDKLNQALGKYIDMFEATNFGGGRDALLSGDEVPAEEEFPLEAAPQDEITDLGTMEPFGAVRNSGRTTAPADPIAVSLYDDLINVVGKKAADKLASELGGANPRTREQLEGAITGALQNADRQSLFELQQRLQGKQSLLQEVGDWAIESLADPSANVPNTVPTSRQPQPASYPPNVANTTRPSTPTRQPAAKSVPVAPTGQRTMLDDIVAAKTQFASLQKQYKSQYQAILGDLPKNVGDAVIKDWHGDLTNSPRDADPETGVNTPYQERIIRQLRSFQVSEQNLPESVRKVLTDFRLTATGAEVIR